MRILPDVFFRSFALAGLLILGFSGCSREAKKAGLLGRADTYYKAGEYDKAEIEYKNVLQLGGRDPQAIGRLGIIYFEQGRLLQASGALKAAIELQPENLDVKLKLGYVALATGKRVEARDAAMFVLERRPGDSEAPILLAESMVEPKDAAEARAFLQKLETAQSAPVLTALAMIHLRERKHQEAETLLGQALQANPKFAAAHSTLANVYLAQKDSGRAETALATAAEVSPPRSAVRLMYAQFNRQTGKLDVAKRLLDEMIRATPDFLPSYILRADIAAAEKQFGQSVELLDKVFVREPVHPDALMLAASVRAANNENEKAIAILEKAVAVYPDPRVHLQLGNAYVVKGDLEKAHASLSEAAKLAPELPAAVLGLAQVNIRRKNFTQAISSLEAFAQKNPSNGDAQLLLGEAYRIQGNFDAALGVYRQLASANPKNAQIQQLIGIVLSQQGKRAEARVALTKASELSPDSLSPIELLVDLDLADKQYASALARISSRIVRTPNDAAAHVIEAKVHFQQGDGDKAEAALNQAIKLRPDSALAHSLLAEHYIRSNQADKAVTALQAAVAKNPSDVKSLYSLAALFEQKKDFTAARAAYEKLLAINPRIGEALNNLASLYSEHFDELDKAQELAQKAKELLPNRPEISDTLGWIHYKKRQYARALTLLEDSAEKLPENAEAHFHFGMAQYMMGNEGGARPALERALQLNAAFTGAEEARQSLAILSVDRAKGSESKNVVYRALEKRKDDPIALDRLAAIFEAEGSTEKALGAYEQAVKANPSNTRAALNMIRLYRSRNEPAKALDLAKATRKFAPADGQVAHVLGRLAYESGDYLWSVGVLQEAVRRLDGDPEAFFDLAEASYSVGQVSNAETAFREALAAKPGFPRAGQAQMCLEMIAIAQNPRESLASTSKVEAAVQADASNVFALVAKAALDEQRGDAQAAKQGYEKVLTLFPGFNPAQRQLTLLYSSASQLDKNMLEVARKARETYPSDPEVAKAFGILSFREGNLNRARDLLLESARSRSADGEIMYYLGLTQHQLKQKENSVRSLQRALELGLPEKLEPEARKMLAAAK